jgi:hypothetical protein
MVRSRPDHVCVFVSVQCDLRSVSCVRGVVRDDSCCSIARLGSVYSRLDRSMYELESGGQMVN